MKKDRSVCLAGLILTILVLFPMLIKGIMCNDELLLRIWAQKGMGTFFRTTIIEENVRKGRVLGAIGNVKFLAFISDNKYVFGTINVIFILAAVGLFGYFTYRLWKNEKFSALLCVLILAFLPFTFEFGVPNAFVIVTLWPMILLEIALIFYLNYLEEERKKDIVISFIMFLWAMFLYEFIITYVLLFPIICFIKNYQKKISLKKFVSLCFPMILAAIVYLILYVGQGYVFPSNYEGTHLNIAAPAAILHVLKVLFVAAFPAYFSYFNEKYRYMFAYYNKGGVRAGNIINPILIVFVLLLAFLLLYFLRQKEMKESKKRIVLKDGLIFAATFFYAIVPALPNALTPMYQEGVTVESFTWIPVSIYLYFAIMLALTYLLWKVITMVNKRWLIGLAVIAITVAAGGVQIRNQVFVEEQVANYERLVAMEDVLKLDYWKQYGSLSVSAPSLYKTQNSMAVEVGHWSEYAAIYGNQLFLDENYNAENSANLVIQKDNSFYLYTDNMKLLITKEERKGSVAVKNVRNKYKVVKISECIWEENGYKVYSLI